MCNTGKNNENSFFLQICGLGEAKESFYWCAESREMVYRCAVSAKQKEEFFYRCAVEKQREMFLT